MSDDVTNDDTNEHQPDTTDAPDDAVVTAAPDPEPDPNAVAITINGPVRGMLSRDPPITSSVRPYRSAM